MPKMDFTGPLLRMLHTALDQKLSNRAQEMDLTSAQIFVLHYINQNNHKDIFQKDVEERFELSHATVSGLINRLESKGFLVSLPSQTDRRFKKLCVTEKARCCDEQMHKNIVQTEQTLLNGFSEEEKAQLHCYLERMLINLGIDLEAVKKRG